MSASLASMPGVDTQFAGALQGKVSNSGQGLFGPKAHSAELHSGAAVSGGPAAAWYPQRQSGKFQATWRRFGSRALFRLWFLGGLEGILRRCPGKRWLSPPM